MLPIIVKIKGEASVVHEWLIEEYVEASRFLVDTLNVKTGGLTVKYLLRLKVLKQEEFIKMLKKMEEEFSDKEKQLKPLACPMGIAWLQQEYIPTLINDQK